MRGMALDLTTSLLDGRPGDDDAGAAAVSTPSSWSASVPRWLPLVFAIACFAAMSGLVLSQAEKMIEPDPYAYRASIAALEDGNLTLTQDQYTQLTQQLEQTPLGGGILQWHQAADGTWISEKNAGYPFLALGFDEAGAMRLAPLFYGALACLGLYLGGRRWLGRWGGAFAVGGYTSAAIVMVMAWRSFMPTFTDASLVAAGLGLLVWTTLAIDRSRRVRVIVGMLAFLALGLAVFVRYTNVAVLAVAALFALFVCLRSRWRLGWTTLLWWALGAVPPLVATLAYNAVVFDGPFSTGYSSTSVKFTLGSIPDNLRVMPSHLWRAMPVFLVGLAAVVGIVGVEVGGAVRRRRARASDPEPATPAPGEASSSAGAIPAADPVPPAVADRWIGVLLLGAWAAIWGLYAAYEWTARMGGAGGPGGGFPGGGALGGGAARPFADSGFLHPNYSIARFYLPAMGAIALLAAWLIVRLPRVLGVLVVVGLFVAGGAGFLATVDSGWASMSVGGPGVPGGAGAPGGAGQVGSGQGGRGLPGGPGGQNGQFPDLSTCPNLPQPPPGGGGGTGGQPGSGQVPPALGGQNGGPPAGITFDENGCPVFPTTTTSPTG